MTEHCLKEWGDPAIKICCLPAGHDGDCYGYPVKSTHGSLLRALRNAREQHRGAVDAVMTLVRARLEGPDVPGACVTINVAGFEDELRRAFGDGKP